jgi:hypothetical protein
MPEGPFGEFTGYYACEKRPASVMHVTAMHWRDDPILLDSPPMKPPCFHFGLPLRAAAIWSDLERCGADLAFEICAFDMPQRAQLADAGDEFAQVAVIEPHRRLPSTWAGNPSAPSSGSTGRPPRASGSVNPWPLRGAVAFALLASRVAVRSVLYLLRDDKRFSLSPA